MREVGLIPHLYSNVEFLFLSFLFWVIEGFFTGETAWGAKKRTVSSGFLITSSSLLLFASFASFAVFAVKKP
jgi:hypothetical protein